MRQSGSGGRRSRGRHHNNGGGNNGNNQNRTRSVASLRHQTFDSNGPDVRVRGNAWQVYEKYQALARDAATAGDPIMAENYLQHAEHYYRITEAIEEAAAMEQRKNNPVPSSQPDMPVNYYTPEGKLAAEQPSAPDAPSADQSAEVEERPSFRQRGRGPSRDRRDEGDGPSRKEEGSGPFFSLDDPEASEGSQPQKLIAQP